MLPTQGRTVVSFLDSWSAHVESWTRASGLNAHVIRYEDMQAKPIPSFRAVLDYLKLERSRDDLKRAVRFSSFKELGAQEDRAGFVERSASDRRFFRAGRAGQWQDALSPAQVERIVEANRAVMERYGYLP